MKKENLKLYGETGYIKFWQEESGQMYQEDKITGHWSKYTCEYRNGKLTGTSWVKMR